MCGCGLLAHQCSRIDINAQRIAKDDRRKGEALFPACAGQGHGSVAPLHGFDCDSFETENPGAAHRLYSSKVMSNRGCPGMPRERPSWLARLWLKRLRLRP